LTSIRVPDGNDDIYFIYSHQPDALYQGDSFALSGHGIEIQVVGVVGGNYNIRRVKYRTTGQRGSRLTRVAPDGRCNRERPLVNAIR
jgi:hypothetical protein